MSCMDNRQNKIIGQEAKTLFTVMSLAVLSRNPKHDKQNSSSYVSDFGDSAHVGIESVPKSPSKSSSGTSSMICGTLNQSSLGACGISGPRTICHTSQTCSKNHVVSESMVSRVLLRDEESGSYGS